MRRTLSLLVLVMLVFALSACSSGATPVADTAPAATEPAQAELPQTGGETPTAPATAIPASSPAPVQTDIPAATQPPVVPATAVVEPTQPVAAPAQPETCTPTPPDALGPFYVPGAPERNKVGEGYVLSGVVRSVDGCAPIPNAMVELWMAGPDGNYADAYRATIFTGQDGAYRFESHLAPPYSGRPPHIHLQVSAPGFETLVTQHYPQGGASQAAFDVVLIPAD